VLRLAARTDRTFPLDAPADLAYTHFASNEDLLGRFLGHDRGEKMPDGCFRVQLAKHGALGLMLQPRVDVRFIEVPPHRVEMRSEGVSLVHSSHEDAKLDATFEGAIVFEPAAHGRTQATCWSTMAMELRLPEALAWLPTPPLEALGNGIVGTAMAALASRLPPLLQADLAAARR